MKFRRVAVVALVAGVLAVVWLWRDIDQMSDGPSVTSQSARVNGVAASSAAPQAGGAVQLPRQLGAAALRLELDAPNDVQAGEVFHARIDVDANPGFRALTLSVTWRNSRLALIGWSAGAFATQSGLPVDFAADEPSDGNVQLNINVSNGSALAGAGTLAELRFQAIMAGTSPLTLQSVTIIDAMGAASSFDIGVDAVGATNPKRSALRGALVTIH